MSLGPIIRVGCRVRFTPRNRGDSEWPSHWAEAMNKRGTIANLVVTRKGATKPVVVWDALKTPVVIDADALDYVIADTSDISVQGRRVRRLPSREVGKTSALTDWAGSVGVIVSPIKEAYVRVRWPDGQEQQLSVFALEPE